jgi:hypothetical protein
MNKSMQEPCLNVQFSAVKTNEDLLNYLLYTLDLYNKCSAKTKALQELINAYNNSLEVAK